MAVNARKMQAFAPESVRAVVSAVLLGGPYFVKQFFSKNLLGGRNDMSTKAATLNKKSVGQAIGQFTRNWMSIVGILALIVIFSIVSYVKFGAQYFLTWTNWKNILLQASTVAIVALGQAIIMLTGAFDISLGRMVCLTSCVGGLLMKNYGVPVPLGILAMFAVGILVGSTNGFLVSFIGVPPMIATLGTQYICYGISKLITQAVPIPKMPEAIAWLGRGYLFKEIPICAILMIVLYVVAQLLLTYTKVGRNIYAVGGSREAAFFSGINVKMYGFGTFVLSGVLTTFGGLVLMSRLNSVAVTNGQNYEFDAVISSIIGGISLAGGKGNVIGTMFGCIFLITLFNGFSQMGVDPFVQDVLKGFVLVAAITLDVMNTNKKKKN